MMTRSMFGVSDEFGDITGIVTLEDVLESVLGQEIVDEVDLAINMQEVAQLRKRERSRNESNDMPGAGRDSAT